MVEPRSSRARTFASPADRARRYSGLSKGPMWSPEETPSPLRYKGRVEFALIRTPAEARPKGTPATAVLATLGKRTAIGNAPDQGVIAPYVKRAPPARRADSGLAAAARSAAPVRTPAALAARGRRLPIGLLGVDAPKPLLLCPGPVMLSEHVIRAVSTTVIGHREPEFSQLLRECETMIKPIVGIRSADTSYRVAFITGSGTAANEAVLSSLGANGPTLVIGNGEFGERLLAAARRHNDDVDELTFAWHEAIDLSAVELALKQRAYELIVVAHHETSSGMLNPIAALAELAHRHGALIAVDAISSIGAETIAAEKWSIDVLTGASGKALSAMPGVGIVIVKAAVLERCRALPSGAQYLNLHAHTDYLRDHAQTPNTPAVHVFVSLHAALEEITARGVMQSHQQIRARAEFSRARLAQMGLVYADFGAMSSSVLTCVFLPEVLTFERLASHLKSKGIVIYNGKGPFTDKLFQIGHIGSLRKHDLRDALREVEAVLAEASRLTRPRVSFPAIERATRVVS